MRIIDKIECNLSLKPNPFINTLVHHFDCISLSYEIRTPTLEMRGVCQDPVVIVAGLIIEYY